MLVVGDPVRQQVRRTIYGSLVLAASFTVTTGPVKQFAPMYKHAPWLNDPFDTVVSFMMFFVPFVAAYCVVRVPLCRRFEPLPLVRVRDLLRGARVVLLSVALTLVSEWTAVAIGANRSAWNGATLLQVAVLAALSLATVLTARILLRTNALIPIAKVEPSEDPDWLSDAVCLLSTRAGWFGPLRSLVIRVVASVDARVAAVVRRHPLWTAVTVWGAFGIVIGVRQSLNEGYRLGAALLFIALLSGGMFGLSVMAGSYLGFVHSPRPLSGWMRRIVDALVAVSVGVLAPFALRYHLWWVVGSHNAVAGLGQLVALLTISSLVIFAVTLVVEVVLGYHEPKSL